MPAIQLADPLYEELRARAADAGYASVDEYVADLLRQDVTEPQNFDHVFTPDRIAELDQIVKNIEQGGPLHTQAEIEAHFKSRHPGNLRKLADEALDDLRAGRTTPLDPETL